MSSTNKTTNLELSQFLGSDSPKWLTDYNADMQKIDAAVGSVQSQANATDLVVSGHSTAIESLQATEGEQGTAIADLRTDVNHNSGDINTINSLIGNGEPTTTDKTIIGAINELNSEIGNEVLTTTASTLSGAINELNEDIQAVGNRRFIFIGDSYADTQYMNWISKTATLLGLVSGVDYYDQSLSGLSFVDDEAYTRLIAQSESVTDKDSITDIMVLMGANDCLASTSPSLYTPIAKFVAKAKELYPNAKVGIGFIARYVDGDGARTWASFTKGLYHYKMGTIAAGYGAYYIDGIEHVMHAIYAQLADHTHPTADCGTTLSRALANFINGAPLSYFYNFALHYVVTGGTDQALGEAFIDGNNLRVVIEHFPEPEEGTTLSKLGRNGSPTELGTMRELYFNKREFMPVKVINDSVYYDGWITFYHNKIYLGLNANNVQTPITVASDYQIFESNECNIMHCDNLVLA